MPEVKCFRDVVFTVASVIFCIYTLNPHRKLFNPVDKKVAVQPVPSQEVNNSSTSSSRLSNERYDELSQRLNRMLIEDHIFTEQHITIDLLVARLGTNSKYITEVIKRSGYGSFYDMVNQHRVRYAISLICQHPDRRLCDIADDCGFASQASMNRAFSAQGKPAPSSFRT